MPIIAMTTSVALVGSTGLVVSTTTTHPPTCSDLLQGSNILQTLLSTPSISTIHAFSRRPLLTHAKLHPTIDPDTTTWPTILSKLRPPPPLFISALGTTQAAAGSTAVQRTIDYDLNLALARAAHAAGTKTYVLVSTSGASATSPFAYPKMKGELEDAVRGLGFEHVVILRPGLLVGDRAESRPVEAVFRGVARGLGALTAGMLKDFWAQDADVVARAAIRAGLACSEGKGGGEQGVWVVGQGEVVRLGKKGEGEV